MPALLSRPSLSSVLAFLSAALIAPLTGACDSLTAPSEPAAIAADTTTAGTAAAKPVAPSAGASAAPAPKPPSDPNAKLVSTDLLLGKGATANSGDSVSVHYVGTLADGTKFDSSRDRNQPFVFTLGKGQVIRGWDQGVVGMKVGGKRKLVIPPALAYGDHGMGKIPAGSTLTFEVELMDVKPAAGK